MTTERLTILIDKYLNNTASPAEEQELLVWYHASNQQEVPWPVANEQEAAAVKARLLRNLQQTITMHTAVTTKTIPFYRRSGWQAAAVILILLSAGGWFWFSRSPKIPGATARQQNNAPQDIVPGSNKAILTLADGSTIVLDSAHNALLAKQGNTRIIKLNNGQLAYQENAKDVSSGAPMHYNMIATPKGGQYEVILPDGSHVWLNAAASLRFPAAFTGNERKVELTGEAYFEVTKNPGKPFKVAINNQDGNQGMVEVFGTHFNINAYHDEPTIRTTLLEGSVKVKSEVGSQKPDGSLHTSDLRPQTSILLKPGQQAQIPISSQSSKSSQIMVQTVDTDLVIAWKNGIFNFDHADIRTVMRQIARWYDVEVVYEGAISSEKFEGEIPRSSTLSEVLKILEISAVHFKIEGRKIIVMP